MSEEAVKILDWYSKQFAKVSDEVIKARKKFSQLNQDLYLKVLNSKNLEIEEIIELSDMVDLKKLKESLKEDLKESGNIKDFDEFLLEDKKS
ncbi:hypothetical protein [Marinifilum fragile]|uniref:hypothetical protein n=1 Tax=Marinifilum fragile TaxID=570161 RepID=UPI002AA62303|nr:hypothetical protein [Marinifilum fragile]